MKIIEQQQKKEKLIKSHVKSLKEKQLKSHKNK